MQPIPCAHCGINFMRQTPDPEAPKLCNSCILREERRVPTKKDMMKTIDIVIKCPVAIQAEIEEYCINNGMDFSKYFLSLHEKIKGKINNEATIITPEMFQEIEECSDEKNLPTSSELRKNKKLVDKKSRFR